MDSLVHASYLVASVLFILSLKRLSRVKTSRQGNAMASLAMLIAVLATVIDLDIVDYSYILAGLVVGSVIGVVIALRVQMTQMPQMVAAFNGMGGGASLLVALSFFQAEVMESTIGKGPLAEVLGIDVGITILLSILVGGLTLTGSGIAFAKLHGLMRGQPILFRGQHGINLLFALSALGIVVHAGFMAQDGETLQVMVVALAGLALLLGVTTVIPIGGADMPVVISLLNSYSGVAAAMTGFVLRNNLLIISGSLVGASGLILTQIMCRGMNRPLTNVLFGGFGATEATGGGEGGEYTNVKEAGVEEVAMILESAASLVVVPGYGLAVAQAQHVTRELADLLDEFDCEVRYAIHPVAGRMPGHMNVLLAEANVPYEKLFEMERINGDFRNTEVVMVVGANDVVNPAANDDPASPIYGMPVLNVTEAQTVLVLKRSLGAGFSGIRNDLFEHDRTLMVFGDAKDTLSGIVEELKEAQG